MAYEHREEMREIAAEVAERKIKELVPQMARDIYRQSLEDVLRGLRYDVETVVNIAFENGKDIFTSSKARKVVSDAVYKEIIKRFGFIEINKKEYTLLTLTMSDVPNVNNVVYPKKVFEDFIKENKDEIENGCIKLTIEDETEKIKEGCASFNTVKLDKVIGTVRNIEDGKITVSVPEDKSELLNNLLNENFKPGMRYIANMDKTDHQKVEKIHKIISFDMIKL